MKIVMIGFMATGKSSVAPLVAERLGLQAIEMDDLIVKRAGKNIGAIFADEGEAAFRRLEAKVAHELRDLDQVVISTGGGVVTEPATMRDLCHQALLLELTADFDTVVKRAAPKPSRPLFKDIDKARGLYQERQPLYSKYPAIRIATDNLTVAQVAETIVRHIKEGAA